MKNIFLGTAPDDKTGDNLRAWGAKANYNARMAAYDAKMLGKMRLFTMGDSMAGYGMSDGYAAFFGMMKLYGYDPDVSYNHGSYYDAQNINDPNVGGIAWPNGPRGWNFAAGGKNVKHMNDVQMTFVREAFNANTLPMHFLISTFQNDQFWNSAFLTPEQICLNVIKVVDELIDVMGRRGILLGPWPHSRLAADATAKHYIDQRMREYAATKPGLIYVSILDALKSGVASEEAADNVNYKGWQLSAGQVGRASWDEIHSAPYGAYLVGVEPLAHAFRIMCREYRGRVFEAHDYSKTKNPLGNFYGAMGRLVGAGGTIVNVADPTPANWTRTATNNLPAGFELVYDQSKGVTLTPTLTGNSDYPLRITASGTPTADFLWALRMRKQFDVAEGYVEIYGKARWVAQNGWGGVNIGGAGEGAPGIASGTIITTLGGAGGGGGADYVMPFELNRNITFHTIPFYYNYGNRSVPLDVGGGFATGVPVSGALEIGRLGIFKTVVPANF